MTGRGALIIAGCLASPAAAQPAWSPFRMGADLEEQVPGPPRAPALQSRGRGFGFLWHAGNPAGAVWELPGRGVDLAIGTVHASGGWRRPLEPLAVTTPSVHARAWQPLGRHRVLAGTITVGQELPRPDGFALVAHPYASVPLVPVDTSAPQLRETAMRFEGLTGWRVGRLAVGAAVGYDTRDRRSSASAIGRAGRNVAQGGTLGMIVEVVPALQLGASANWNRRNETLSIRPIGAVAHAYKLEGLGGTGPISVPPEAFLRELATTRAEAGPEAGGTLGSVRWLVAWHRTWIHADQASVREEPPRNDTWRARGSTLRAALRLPLGGVVLGADLGRAVLSGDATIFDLQGFIYSAKESRAWLSGTIRRGTLGDAWQAALTAGTVRERRMRRDFLHERRAETTSWTPGASVAVAARAARGTWFALDGGLAARYSVAGFPDPAGAEFAYARFIAPALAWSAARVVVWRAGVGARQQLGTGAVVLHAAFSRARPLGESLPPQPDADRRQWDVRVALEW